MLPLPRNVPVLFATRPYQRVAPALQALARHFRQCRLEPWEIRPCRMPFPSVFVTFDWKHSNNDEPGTMASLSLVVRQHILSFPKIRNAFCLFPTLVCDHDRTTWVLAVI